MIYRDGEGKEQRQKARLVCVAGNAVETARLLMLSDSYEGGRIIITLYRGGPRY